jgi:PhzF family phenazine biosynthesis protein
MSTRVPFQQVDVFSAVPFRGNPVAVILDGNRLSKEQMQQIANWTNLSETTFVCEPTDPLADYRLRIFTPMSELKFAGHPTIGSAHAVLRHGLRPRTEGRLVQQCGKGLVSLQIEGDRVFLTLPEPKMQDIPSKQMRKLAGVLGVAPSEVRAGALVDVGVEWLTLQLANADQVRSISPDMAGVEEMTPPGATGIAVFGMEPPGSGTQVEVRAFAPAEGIPEDPVCGSGNGCVALLIRHLGLVEGAGYSARQGRTVGRDGRVEVRYSPGGEIMLGGHAVTCIEGAICL